MPLLLVEAVEAFGGLLRIFFLFFFLLLFPFVFCIFPVDSEESNASKEKLQEDSVLGSQADRRMDGQQSGYKRSWLPNKLRNIL
jgi:hypothetical protein